MFRKATDEFTPGQRLPVNIGPVGKAELAVELGRGGFGAMWKIIDPKTGQAYALKIIGGVKPDSLTASRVRLEAEVNIASDYIVPVLGLRQLDATTFLILFDYFESRSLDLLIRQGALAAGQKLELFRRMLVGVADAHRHNVIHRDLKPANVLVNQLGQVKIIDFGISKFKDKNVTVSGQIMGTPAYLAPELLFSGSKVADARTDVYSLGHIFYELVRGRHFWHERDIRSLSDFLTFINQAAGKPPVGLDLTDFHCDFCSRAPEIIRRMVMVEPAQRYRTVSEVLTDLGFDYNPAAPLPADLHLRCPVLIIETGTNRGAKLVLGLRPGERREIGRADLAGSDASLSRRHLEISRAGDRYFGRDLGSKNGTLVGGLALEPDGPAVELQHTDRIKMGDIFLRFVFVAEA